MSVNNTNKYTKQNLRCVDCRLDTKNCKCDDSIDKWHFVDKEKLP